MNRECNIQSKLYDPALISHPRCMSLGPTNKAHLGQYMVNKEESSSDTSRASL